MVISFHHRTELHIQCELAALADIMHVMNLSEIWLPWILEIEEQYIVNANGKSRTMQTNHLIV